MANDMSLYYEGIKAKAGINRLLQNDTEDHKSNHVFAKLRPKSPYTFEELLSP
jgi:hypothetical protein